MIKISKSEKYFQKTIDKVKKEVYNKPVTTENGNFI